MPKHNQSYAKAICDTWGVKKDAGYWNAGLKFDFKKDSILDRNKWYATITVERLNLFPL